MTYSDEFSNVFYRKSDYLPGDMVKAWDFIVRLIEEGYDDVEPELDNDLSIRAQIESLILDGDLERFASDHQRFSGDIADIDTRLKELIMENPFYRDKTDKRWWQLIILKKGGSKYYEDILKLYGIKIELVT